MPMAAMSRSVRSAAARASVATPLCEAHISVGECSTDPGCGKICPNGRCAIDTTSPAAPTSIALALVVPWSNARMYFLFAKLLSFISSRGIEFPFHVRNRFEQLYLICPFFHLTYDRDLRSTPGNDARRSSTLARKYALFE